MAAAGHKNNFLWCKVAVLLWLRQYYLNRGGSIIKKSTLLVEEASMKFARVAVIISLSLSSPTSAFTTPAYYRTQISTAAAGNNYRSYNTYLKESTVEEEESAEDTTVDEVQPQEESSPILPTKRTSTTTKITAERIEKVTKERPYPLFLAEKAVSILPSFQSNSDSYYSITNNTPKERIIVLGTGWGAASFLKTIDCNKYDVTVISPRNYFVFTPMLAGASVGTVEFRSITEPIREVSEVDDYNSCA